MPIVYIHGVAVRDENEELNRALRRFREVSWPTIEGLLREHVAPAISDDPVGVPIMRSYWGDLGARFAWDGRSLVSQPVEEELEDAARREAGEEEPPRPPLAEAIRDAGIRGVRTTVTAIRRPLEVFLPTFLGDVMTYLTTRGTSEAPGPIPLRVLETLDVAQFAADSREEPLVVLTHSMGGQILYDLLTHFIPRMPEHREIRVDFWCATASQIGLFEELKLFLASDPAFGSDTGTQAPRPPAEHLGGWWNVWDHADLLSFRAEGIFEGVDDGPFFAAGTLATDHNRYLDSAPLYRTFAERVRNSLAGDVENPGSRSTEG
jgi:hypothetical protein